MMRRAQPESTLVFPTGRHQKFGAKFGKIASKGMKTKDWSTEMG